MRWIQFGAVSGVMRTQANGVAIPSKARPQIPDRDILPTWKRYANPDVTRAFANIVWLGLERLTQIAVAIVISGMLARYFGPDVFGKLTPAGPGTRAPLAELAVVSRPWPAGPPGRDEQHRAPRRPTTSACISRPPARVPR